MRFKLVLLVLVCLSSTLVGRSHAADDDPLQLTITLVKDSDKDIRAAGLQQVRESLKGQQNTEKFASLLPTLPPEAQVGLLSALADRGDKAAAPFVRRLAVTDNEPVKVGAIAAIGALGDSGDAAALLKLLGEPSAAVKTAAVDALTRLPGEKTTVIIVAALKAANGNTIVDLINILAARRAAESASAVLNAAVDSRADVRRAAMAALARLAEPDPTTVAAMMQGILKAAPGAERDAAELALKQVCDKSKSADQRAALPLAELGRLNHDQVAALLPAVGRIGGKPAYEFVNGLIVKSADAQTTTAAVRALCLWPDATVTDRLVELTEKPVVASERGETLKALIRVAALHDKRTDAQRLELLKQALELAQSDQEKNLVVRRVGTIHTMDAFHWVLPYLDQPALAQKACESVTEMAHHRELREPHKAEFDAALDKVIATTKNPVTADEAARYQKGQTFDRSKKKED